MRPSFVSIIASGAWAGGMGRIVGGTDVTPQFKYPWLAAIFRYGGACLRRHDAAAKQGADGSPLCWWGVWAARASRSSATST
ncbi:hypothetical protein DSO57_1006140 [Entomophthora muscae]|uniref:Uncharacterized protein n=1 Tax=Entomophthora muscae TaxID=34485 RepID=A0ACC2UHN4_9FUNG|nr:hypothetical protein DSO57_1006140 [Entomophthora muscae]